MSRSNEAEASVAERLADSARDFYRHALRLVQQSGVRHLIGGAFALEHHAGVARWTKDLDLFVRPADRDRILWVFEEAGYRTEIRFPHWLSKAGDSEHVIDVISSSGNGLCAVDDLWFEHAVSGRIFDVPVRVIPPEEMVWSKGFIMERERYDGADIAHLLRACARTLDWSRLLQRFGAHWRVLLTHLVLFGFIYPAHRLLIPDWIMEELMRRLRVEMTCLPSDRELCQGTLLSWSQYLVHTERGDYRDARHRPHGVLTETDTALVTERLSREHMESSQK